MICNSTDAERLYFILLCDSAHERPKSLLDFAQQQRFAIFGAKNTANIKRRECISHGPSLISIVPPGRDQILNTSTGDKSPSYFLVVPPEHTGTATALTLKCPNSQGVASNAPPVEATSKNYPIIVATETSEIAYEELRKFSAAKTVHVFRRDPAKGELQIVADFAPISPAAFPDVTISVEEIF